MSPTRSALDRRRFDQPGPWLSGHRQRLQRPDRSSLESLPSKPDDGAAPSPVRPAEQRSAEGLIDQLRTRISTQDGNYPDGWEPGTTDWEPFEVPAAAVRAHDSPGEVMTALATEIEAAGLGTDQWEPGGAERRFHCIRGVTDDGELCV